MIHRLPGLNVSDKRWHAAVDSADGLAGHGLFFIFIENIVF